MINKCKTRTLALAVAIALQTPATLNCAGHRVPDLAQVFSEAGKQTGKRPIILVPGILNLALVNGKTREVVWPSAFRSDDDDIALPITGDPLNSSDDLIATKAIESVRFLPLTPKINFLGSLLDALRRHAGYKEGNWDQPAADGDRDTFYTFVYDWRRDNVQVAQQLIERVVLLKRKLNRPDLQFNVVAISMGGLIARYAAMYGNAELPADKSLPTLTWAGLKHFERIFMFGVPNEGSMEAFATILNGYSISEGANKPRRLFHKLSREDAFSELAVFQLMPHSQTARFLDQDLKPLKIDLYNPASWKLYKWSLANDPEFRKHFARRNVADKTAANHSPANVLETHLAAALERTRLFHQALDVPQDSSPVALLAFVGDCEDTLTAPVIYYDKKKNRWITLTVPKELRGSDGRTISREEVKQAMYSPGDGRVTRASVLAEHLGPHSTQSSYRTALPIVQAFFACGGHGQLHNNRILQNNALTMLVSEAVK